MRGNEDLNAERKTPECDRKRLGPISFSMAWVVAGTILGLITVPVAWRVTDTLEADDDFCNSCHLPDGPPLHRRIRQAFDSRPPIDLAARHASARKGGPSVSPGFRCIDCHGGVGLVGRARVKVLSAIDGVLYLAGRFEEPETMSWPLEDADCRRCHPNFARKGDGFDGEAFHDRLGHNTRFSVPCVDCHSAHDRDVDPERWFLNPSFVRTRCAGCHVEYADERSGNRDRAGDGDRPNQVE